MIAAVPHSGILIAKNHHTGRKATHSRHRKLVERNHWRIAGPNHAQREAAA